MLLLTGTVLAATPIAGTLSQTDVNAPIQRCDVTQSDRDSLHFPRFQTLMTWNTVGYQEFPVDRATAVPEPDTLLLLTGGLLVAAGLARKRVRREQANISAR